MNQLNIFSRRTRLIILFEINFAVAFYSKLMNSCYILKSRLRRYSLLNVSRTALACDTTPGNRRCCAVAPSFTTQLSSAMKETVKLKIIVQFYKISSKHVWSEIFSEIYRKYKTIITVAKTIEYSISKFFLPEIFYKIISLVF